MTGSSCRLPLLLTALAAAALCLLPSAATAESTDKKLEWKDWRLHKKKVEEAVDATRCDPMVLEALNRLVADGQPRSSKVIIAALEDVTEQEDKARAAAQKLSAAIGKGKWTRENHDELKLRLREAGRAGKLVSLITQALAEGNPAMRRAFGEAALERKDGRWHGLLARIYATIPEDDDAIELVYQATRHEDPRARAAILKGIAGSPKGWNALVSQRITDKSWAVRALAVRLAVKEKNKRAVGEMIGALSCAPLRIQQMMAGALEVLTGQSFGTNASKWAFWWQANRKYFGKHTTAGAGPTCKQGRYVPFYDLEIHSDRVVFVIDVSFSMDQKAITGYTREGRAIESEFSRIYLVKRQLRRTLKALEDGVEFNLVAFGGKVSAWQPGLTAMSAKTRKKALRWVDRLKLSEGGTRMNGALHHVFAQLGFGDPSVTEPAADTVVVLSDGAPTDGWPSGRGTKGRAVVLETINDWNEDGLFVIHTVALRGAAQDFMKDLAGSNGGKSIVR